MMATLTIQGFNFILTGVRDRPHSINAYILLKSLRFFRSMRTPERLEKLHLKLQTKEKLSVKKEAGRG